MKNIKPLRQDNLSEGGNEREVHGLKESGFITSAQVRVIFTRTRIPSGGILHIHLSVITINYPK